MLVEDLDAGPGPGHIPPVPLHCLASLGTTPLISLIMVLFSFLGLSVSDQDFHVVNPRDENQ